MPYKKSYRKKRYKKGSKSTRAVAYKALKIARRNKNAMELKISDTFGAINPPTAGTSIFMNLLEKGTANNQRIGDDVKIKSLHLKMSFDAPTTPIQTFMYMVIWDKENVIGTGAEILASTSPLFNILSPKNQQNKYSFKVLLWRRVSPSDTGQNPKFRSHIIRINKFTHFDAGNNIEKGALKLIFWSQSVALDGGIQYYARLHYVDP